MKFKTYSNFSFLLLVACFFLVSINAFYFNLNRALEWDEAVYLSQIFQSVPSTSFYETRTHGIILLISPLAFFEPPIWVIRLFLTLVSTTCLWVNTRYWSKEYKHGAYLLGIALITFWPILFYSSEISPNLFAGLFLLSSLTLLHKQWSSETSNHLTTLTCLALGSLAVFIRPSDITLALIALCLVSLYQREYRLFIQLSGIILLGWTLWMIESYYFFDNPANRIVEAGMHATNISNDKLILLEHARSLTTGHLFGPSKKDSITEGLVSVTVLLALGLYGTAKSIQEKKDKIFPMGLLIGGISILTFYMGFVQIIAPRFLIPAYICLSIPASIGLYYLKLNTLWKKGTTEKLILTTIILIITHILIWSIETAITVEKSQNNSRKTSLDIGKKISTLNKNPNCIFASQYAAPQIQFYSKCQSKPFNVSQFIAQDSVSPPQRGTVHNSLESKSPKKLQYGELEASKSRKCHDIPL